VSKKMQQPPRTIQNVFVLMLLALFAGLSTFLVTMGAQLYKTTVDRGAENNTARIMSAVVRSAVWAEDGGEVLVESYPEHNLKALAIKDDFDGEIYYQRLFCHDGYLWESYTSEERGFDIEAGENLCELAEFDPSLEGKMLTVRLVAPDGTESTIKVALRAGGADE